MKKIRSLLILLLLFSLISPLAAQSDESYKQDYNGHKLSVTYVPARHPIIKYIGYDGTELTKLISKLSNESAGYKNERDSYKKESATKQTEIERLSAMLDSLSQVPSQGQVPTRNQSSDTTLISLKRDRLKLEDQRDSLQGQVKLLNDSIHLLNAALEKVYSQQMATFQKTPIPTGTFQHVGAYYRIGSPLLFNSLLNQKEGSERFWHRQMTLSHQVGVYWNSASFSDKLPMTYGVGLEYSRMSFSASIDHLSDTLYNQIDNDKDHYTAFLTYNNVNEEATLRYISIPLTFSIGTPRVDRISGYFQASLVTSSLVNEKRNPTSASGTYSRAGLYNHFNSDTTNTTLDLYLDDFAPLGFGSNKDVGSEKRKDAPLIGVVVSGRLSGGVYIPLCNTAKGETSQWALKVGVNLDMSISPIAIQKGYVAPKAKYQLDQYNLLSGSGCWYINPGLEFGILYMFNK